jgi:hypothetical protein
MKCPWLLMSSFHSPLQVILKNESTLGNVGAPSDYLCWIAISWWLIYCTRTMLKNCHDINALSSLIDHYQLRLKMFDQGRSLNRLIWSCNCLTILCAHDFLKMHESTLGWLSFGGSSPFSKSFSSVVENLFKIWIFRLYLFDFPTFPISSIDVIRHIQNIIKEIEKKILFKNTLKGFKNNYNFWDFEKSIT